MQPRPLPESQNHWDWREPKSRNPFFRSLLVSSELRRSLGLDATNRGPACLIRNAHIPDIRHALTLANPQSVATPVYVKTMAEPGVHLREKRPLRNERR